jgi:hypothetical protein
MQTFVLSRESLLTYSVNFQVVFVAPYLQQQVSAQVVVYNFFLHNNSLF